MSAVYVYGGCPLFGESAIEVSLYFFNVYRVIVSCLTSYLPLLYMYSYYVYGLCSKDKTRTLHANSNCSSPKASARACHSKRVMSLRNQGETKRTGKGKRAPLSATLLYKATMISNYCQ